MQIFFKWNLKGDIINFKKPSLLLTGAVRQCICDFQGYCAENQVHNIDNPYQAQKIRQICASPWDKFWTWFVIIPLSIKIVYT